MFISCCFRMLYKILLRRILRCKEQVARACGKIVHKWLVDLEELFRFDSDIGSFRGN